MLSTDQIEPTDAGVTVEVAVAVLVARVDDGMEVVPLAFVEVAMTGRVSSEYISTMHVHALHDSLLGVVLCCVNLVYVAKCNLACIPKVYSANAYVVLCASFIFSLIVSRVEVNILRSINPHFIKIRV